MKKILFIWIATLAVSFFLTLISNLSSFETAVISALSVISAHIIWNEHESK